MKLFKFFAAFFAAFALVSCNNSDDNVAPNPKGGEALITVKIEGTNTRALDGTETATDAENKINSLEFFVFNDNGTFQKYYKPASLSGSQYSFLVSAGNLKVLVAANQNLGTTTLDYADFKKTLNATVLNDGTSRTAPTAFAMAAEGQVTVVESETNVLDLTVRRLMSKVNAPTVKDGIAVTAPDDKLLEVFELAADGTVPTNIKWTFDGYAVINGINKSYAFEYTLSAWKRFTGAENFKTEFDIDENITDVYSGTAADVAVGFLPAATATPVYVYECVPTKLTGGDGTTATTFAPDEVVAFIVKGTFSGDGVDAVTRYWRVNMIKDDIWKIYRNTVYKVTMNEIKTIGWATPKEAEEEGPIVDPTENSISINIATAPWDVRVQDIDI